MPYRVQGQMFKNPFTQSEINVERLQSRPVGHPEIVDSILTTHYGYRPEFPQQFDVITSRSELEQMLKGISQNHWALGYYGLSIESSRARSTPSVLQQFGIQVLSRRGPWAITLSLTVPEFATFVVDLRQVVHHTGQLPTSLEQFLLDPHNVFLMAGVSKQSRALENLTGITVQTEEWSRRTDPRHSIFAVDLPRLAEDWGVRDCVDFWDLVHWTQGSFLPPWIQRLATGAELWKNDDIPTIELLSMPPAVSTVVAAKSSLVMYAANHLLLRFANRAPPPLRLLTTIWEGAYTPPIVGLGRINLPIAGEPWFGGATQQARQVAKDWKKQAQRLGAPHYVIWFDGFEILQAALGVVAAQISASPLNARDRQSLLLKFIHQCSIEWRRLFEPKGMEPGSTIRPDSLRRYSSRN
ncbi:MAG: hypothetical protein GY696_18390 [Gammaproteobacteria bacterium]|nr:hypothetical protein [Gammaproteobacteria bacterium]